MVDVEPLVLEPEDGEDADQIGPIIWNYYKVLCVQSKKGGAKNVTSHFAIQISPNAVQHKHSLIFLAGLFLDKQEQILESANQFVKIMIIGMHNSKLPGRF